jgi:alpha-L-fucosidase
MKRLYCLALLALLATPASTAAEYRANWESLARHDAAPEWFRDAKFGIYFHWGPYSVPAFGNEHYPRTMYGHPSGKKPVDTGKGYNPAIGFQSFREHEFHKKTYGDPAEFEYHHLIPLFRAEHFDAKEWAQLFADAGARFAGPVAEHHDGYAMWDSDLTPWNAADTGPRRDIVSEMAQAVRDRGMKFITTFHHAKNGRPAESDKPPALVALLRPRTLSVPPPTGSCGHGQATQALRVDAEGTVARDVERQARGSHR